MPIHNDSHDFPVTFLYLSLRFSGCEFLNLDDKIKPNYENPFM